MRSTLCNFKNTRRLSSMAIPLTVLFLVASLLLSSSYFARLVHASFGSWGDTSLINACENSRGNVSLVSPGTNCGASETQVTWLKDVDAGSGLSITRSSSGATLSLSSNNDGWTSAGETWTYASSTSITVPSDATAKYSPGDKIRLKQGGSYKYFYVIGVTSTVLTVTGGSDYSVANASITDNYYSKSVTPVGFPQWFNWSPGYSGGGSMSLSSSTTSIAQFSITGRQVNVLLAATTNTGGTASTTINVTEPVAPSTGSSSLVGTAHIDDGSGGNPLAEVFADTGGMKLIKNGNIALTTDVHFGTTFSYAY